MLKKKVFQQPDRPSICVQYSHFALSNANFSIYHLGDGNGPGGRHCDAIQLQDISSKGNGGRTIPLNRDLKAALVDLKLIAKTKRMEVGFGSRFLVPLLIPDLCFGSSAVISASPK